MDNASRLGLQHSMRTRAAIDLLSHSVRELQLPSAPGVHTEASLTHTIQDVQAHQDIAHLLYGLAGHIGASITSTSGCRKIDRPLPVVLVE